MTQDKEAPAAAGTRRNQFGTFAGVFTPSILTILGVIMFLRAGYVIGQSGIRNALLILLIAESITLLTALSMAAIATNLQVKGGGAYFMISRTLGAQFGGSIGLALYLAQALSVPFYVLGFTEAVTTSFPAAAPFFPSIALGTAGLLFLLNMFGAGWALKAQFLVMTLLGLSIVVFLGGAVLNFDGATFAANWEPGTTAPSIGFWVILALYFPAVTGILAGINMSGDLKDPPRALVRGTLGAIAVGFAVYAAQMLLCGGAQAREDLIARPYEMLLHQALFGAAFLVIGGVFAATLSSALGSFMGAPRVLQALARDRLFPGLSPFGRGTAKGDEPREALWLTLAITAAVIVPASGEDARASFDMVATIVTMFFLCTYGMINLAAFVESFGRNPSFRPRFRYYHWTASLLGAVLCLGIMVLIHAAAALAAVVMIAALYVFISRRVYEAGFGDARRGFVYALVLRNLRRLRLMPTSPKNWRPSILVLAGTPRNGLPLIRCGTLLEADMGLVTAADILVGDPAKMMPRRDAAHAQMERLLEEHDLNAFAEVIVTGDLDEGIRVLTQAHSIGPIKPNTVVMGWPHEEERVQPFFEHLRAIRGLGKSVVCLLNEHPVPGWNPAGRIDVWWRGKENGSLMLILAHLVTRNWEWRRAAIRINRLVASEDGLAPAREAMHTLAAAGRIDAEVTVIASRDPFPAVFRRHSRDASLVFLGFQPPPPEDAQTVRDHFEHLVEGMPPSLLVSSSGDADLLV